MFNLIGKMSWGVNNHLNKQTVRVKSHTGGREKIVEILLEAGQENNWFCYSFFPIPDLSRDDFEERVRFRLCDVLDLQKILRTAPKELRLKMIPFIEQLSMSLRDAFVTAVWLDFGLIEMIAAAYGFTVHGIQIGRDARNR